MISRSWQRSRHAYRKPWPCQQLRILLHRDRGCRYSARAAPGLWNIFSCSRHTKDEKLSPTRVAYHTRQLLVSYAIAFFFGLIHGMGFSNFLRTELKEGGVNSPFGPPEETVTTFSDSLGWKLFSFNVGLELAQIMVVVIILIVSYFVMDILKIRQRVWNVTISSIAGFMALGLIFGWL